MVMYLCLENRGLRICLQSETRTTVYDLHKHSKLQKLEHRRVAHLHNLIFKDFKGTRAASCTVKVY